MYCKNCGNEIKNNSKFCNKCGTGSPKKESFYNKILYWFKKNKAPVIALLTLIIIFIIISYNYEKDTTDYSNSTNLTEDSLNNEVRPISSQQNQSEIQNKISPAVVNIICLGADIKNSSGGSGTIVNSSGFILTNAHIILQDEYENPVTKLCIISLPDEKGHAKEIYYGEPIIIPKLSNQYDLAFIQIIDVYRDDDGMIHGKFPTNFTTSLKTICENSDVNLGDSVRVFGYPEISGGGYFLTVTDGVVSSLPNDGTIVTSAKIDHGNSGGIAVDGNGCFIGIPSMSSNGEFESLGVIISNNTILDFINKVNTILNKQ